MMTPGKTPCSCHMLARKPPVQTGEISPQSPYFPRRFNSNRAPKRVPESCHGTAAEGIIIETLTNGSWLTVLKSSAFRPSLCYNGKLPPASLQEPTSYRADDNFLCSRPTHNNTTRRTAMSSVTSALSKTVTAASTAASASSTNRATPQAGILEGSNPSKYDPSNPIFLFIIQVRQRSAHQKSLSHGGTRARCSDIPAASIRSITVAMPRLPYYTYSTHRLLY